MKLNQSLNSSVIIDVADHIRNLPTYPAGKPIEETQREYGVKQVVKLASNENPLGASPMGLQAISEGLKQTHLYPDHLHFSLKRALAQANQCFPENIVIGSGSNEIIDFLMRVLGSKKSNIVSPSYSFIAYRLCAGLQGLEYVEAPVKDDFQMDVDSILKKVNDQTAFVILANPNNPTGTFLKREEVERLAAALLKKGKILVLDYAYWEYVEDKSIPSPEEMLKKFSNIVVLKTFSKIYGLAGLRVGYMISEPEIARVVEKARQPFNVSAVGLIAAEAALKDTAHLKKSFELNQKSRGEVLKILSEYNVRVLAGQGNFVFVDFKKPVSELYTGLLKQGMILRPLANYGLTHYFRITLGLSSENKKLEEALKKVML